jgi:uncharacterized protein (DUF433 family)
MVTTRDSGLIPTAVRRAATILAPLDVRTPKPGLASDVFWGSVGFMNREQLLQRIWIDPGRCGGQPCIRGHRIWVSLILDLLAAGESVEAILEDYPGISREDVQACIAYGSEMARERFVEIPLEPAGA